eukprot:SAG31_NODE_4732_length_2994_cov_1.539710_3_plen_112_part_00
MPSAQCTVGRGQGQLEDLLLGCAESFGYGYAIERSKTDTPGRSFGRSRREAVGGKMSKQAEKEQHRSTEDISRHSFFSRIFGSIYVRIRSTRLWLGYIIYIGDTVICMEIE